MKQSSYPGVRELKRLRLFGVGIALTGLGLSIYGGLSLVGVYSREQDMVVLEIGFSPEKGQLWVNCLTGVSMMLIGVALRLKAGGQSGKTPERPE